MNLSSIIKSRRSIRQFKPDMPRPVDIKALLEAGRWAPSGLNNQPWRFMVIKSAEQREVLAGMTHYGKIVKSAPVAIAVFLDLEESYNRDKDLMAVGACIQNMLLVAHARGLGACWLGEILNRKEKASDLLRPGPHLELMALISVGIPKKKKLAGKRKNLDALTVKGRGCR